MKTKEKRMVKRGIKNLQARVERGSWETEMLQARLNMILARARMIEAIEEVEVARRENDRAWGFRRPEAYGYY